METEAGQGRVWELSALSAPSCKQNPSKKKNPLRKQRLLTFTNPFGWRKTGKGRGRSPEGRDSMTSGADRPGAMASAGRLLLLWLLPATLVTTRGKHLPQSHKVSYTSLPPVAARSGAARTQAHGGSLAPSPPSCPGLCAPSSVPPSRARPVSTSASQGSQAPRTADS